jgi:WD40 repeat protein
MPSSRRIRYEEYAAHGEVEEISESLTHIKIRASHNGDQVSECRTPNTTHTINSSQAISHRQNDKYMNEFDKGFEELAATAKRNTGTASNHPKFREKVDDEILDQRLDRANFIREDSPKEQDTDLQGTWYKGPASPGGTVHSVSAQPTLCMALSKDKKEVVVGSSDHALYVVPLLYSTQQQITSRKVSAAASKPRTLYTKKFGHTEWVTCVAYLSDNRIVSGGMDSKLCLWDATGIRCEELLGHAGSVSLVRNISDQLLLSAGYDKTIRVWNVGKKASTRSREASCLKAHSAPIMAVSLLYGSNSVVVSGDRDGCVHIVDLEQGKILRKNATAHQGHVTIVLGSGFQNPQEAKDDESSKSPQQFYTGGQDGIVRVWDTRQKSSLYALDIHIDKRSGKAGAVGFLQESEDGNALLTGGADGTIKVLDKRRSFNTLYNFTEHRDFIYAMHVKGSFCFSGSGNGMLHVHDWKKGKLLYGLGANRAAVRAIETTSNQLIASGDDGSVIVYDM